MAEELGNRYKLLIKRKEEKVENRSKKMKEILKESSKEGSLTRKDA